MNVTIPVISDDLDDEELALCDSFNATQILDMNSTFQLDGKSMWNFNIKEEKLEKKILLFFLCL